MLRKDLLSADQEASMATWVTIDALPFLIIYLRSEAPMILNDESNMWVL